jgi:hypothetical protein
MPVATPKIDTGLRAALVPFLLVLALIALSLVISGLDNTHVVIREGGWVESATVVFYQLAFLGCLYMMWSKHWPEAWSGAVLLAAAAARELDAHKAFTLESISSIRYWRSDLVPGVEKTVLFAVMSVTAILVVRTAWPPFWRRLRASEPHAITLAAIPVLYLVSAIGDTIHPDEQPGRLNLFLLAVEETFEMGMALCALVALIQWELHVRRTLGALTLDEDL